MKKLLISRLTASRGRILTITAAATVSWVARAAAAYGVDLGPEDVNLITGVAFFGVGWLIDAVILRINADGVKKLQIAINASPDHNLKVDGYAGSETRAAAMSNP